MSEPCPGNCVTQATLNREIQHVRDLIDERDRANQRALELAAARVAAESQRLIAYVTLVMIALSLALRYWGR